MNKGTSGAVAASAAEAQVDGARAQVGEAGVEGKHQDQEHTWKQVRAHVYEHGYEHQEQHEHER